jgi:hypothetical protein
MVSLVEDDFYGSYAEADLAHELERALTAGKFVVWAYVFLT